MDNIRLQTKMNGINYAKLEHESEEAMEWREVEAISLMYGRSGILL